MNIHGSKRLFVAAAVLAAVAIFATGFFVALGVRSVVAGPDSAPAAQAPVVSHTYDQIELPTGTWTGLDADTLDGLSSTQIQDADDYVSNAGYCTTAGDADTVDGMHAGQAGTNYIPYADASGNVGIGTTSPGTNRLKVQGDAQITGALSIGEGAIQDGKIVAADIKDNQIGTAKQSWPFAFTLPTPHPASAGSGTATSWSDLAWDTHFYANLEAWGHTRARIIYNVYSYTDHCYFRLYNTNTGASYGQVSVRGWAPGKTIISAEFAPPAGGPGPWVFQYYCEPGATAFWLPSWAIILY